MNLDRNNVVNCKNHCKGDNCQVLRGKTTVNFFVSIGEIPVNYHISRGEPTGQYFLYRRKTILKIKLAN